MTDRPPDGLKHTTITVEKDDLEAGGLEDADYERIGLHRKSVEVMVI